MGHARPVPGGAGLAAFVTPDGEVAARLPDWREGVLTVEIPSETG